MGMDYTHSGSANYPRFDREICAVAEVFGGKKSENLKERKNTENERPFGYWFGFLSSDDSDLPKFIFRYPCKMVQRYIWRIYNRRN